MTLTTEDLGDVPNVDSMAMDAILSSDGFGKFAILSRSDQEFIQAGNDWQPGQVGKRFLEAHDSDPWVLEYREADRQFRAAGHVTLDQVRQAFWSYLRGESGWRSGFEWGKLEF